MLYVCLLCCVCISPSVTLRAYYVRTKDAWKAWAVLVTGSTIEPRVKGELFIIHISLITGRTLAGPAQPCR